MPHTQAATVDPHVARAVPARAARRLRPPRRRPVVVDVLAGLAGLGLGVTLGLAVVAESAGSLSARYRAAQGSEVSSMLGLIYSLVSYAGFLGVFSYFALFCDGILVPRHVDTGEPSGLALALAVNLALLLVFGLQHSIMAREGFKRAWTRLIPQHLERATYVLASSLALALLVWQWRPLPAPGS